MPWNRRNVQELSLEELLSTSPVAFFSMDDEWRFEYLNPAAERLLATVAGDVVGQTMWEVFPASVGTAFEHHYREAVERQRGVEFVGFYPPLDGWFQVQAVPHEGGLGVWLHDVGHLKTAEARAARLAEVRESLRTVATAVASGTESHAIYDLVCQQAHDLVLAHASWVLRFGHDACEVMSARLDRGEHHGLPGPGSLVPLVEAGYLARVRDTRRPVVVPDRADAGWSALGLEAAVIVPISIGDDFWGALAVAWSRPRPEADDDRPWLEDLSELIAVALDSAATRERLAMQARTDALTGLVNRRVLQTRLAEGIARATRHGHPLTYVLVDVDHLKTVNDGFGHDAGDRVLRDVAALLRAACRAEDVAARIGGDEFALILDGTDVAHAQSMVDRVRSGVRSLPPDDVTPVTVSAGFAQWTPGQTSQDLQRRADDALYWAKLNGRDQAWAYDADVMDGPRPEDRARRLGRSGDLGDPAELQASIASAKAFWQATLDALTKHVAVLDEHGTIIAVNDAWRRFAEDNGGYDGVGVGANYLDVCDRSAADEPLAAEVAAGLRSLLAGERDAFEAEYACHGNGQQRWFAMRANRFPADRPRRVVVHHENLTERHQAEQRLAFQARMLDQVDAAVVAVGLDGMVMHANRCAAERFGLAVGQSLGESVLRLGVDAQATDHAREAVRAFNAGTPWEIRSDARLADGTVLPIWARVTPVRDPDGRVVAGLAVLMDVAEQQRQERELQRAHDYLATLTESMADGMVVVDREGIVRDANRAASELLARPHEALVGRSAAEALYGDPGARSPLITETGPHRREGDDTFVRAGGIPLPVAWSSAELQMPPLVDGRVVVFRDASSHRRREQHLEREAAGLRWAHRVHAALDRDALVLAAQPIVALATGRTTSHELLLRLHDDDGGLLPASVFLPSAEEHGLMTAVDAWVLRHATDVVAGGGRWHINVSARSIGDAEVLAGLRRLVRRTGDPSVVTVELTETAILDDVERTGRFARELHEMGCRLALDDFGTGYNTLSRLQDLPVDELKIDTRFVAGLAADRASESVVRAIVGLAADLGISTVAEGVEDTATAQRLRELGVDEAQGLLYGPAVELAATRPT